MLDCHAPAPRVFARVRPGVIDVHKEGAATAVSRPAAFDRWNAGLKAASDDAPNVITMYDVIGEDFWSGGGVTAKGVAAQLRAIGAQDVEVHLNSPGGDMFEGIAIYNLLREHQGDVLVKIVGLAASAASIIAMAGDEVQMGDASFIMIHDCWVLATGNRHAMLETAAWLEPFDAAMAGVYAARTGQDVVQVAEWMDANQGDGTYFAAAQAIELGFADALLSDQVSERPEARATGRVRSDLLKAELALCGQMPRSEARALLNKIKGKPDAALNPAKPDAGDLSWVGAAAALTTILKS